MEEKQKSIKELNNAVQKFRDVSTTIKNDIIRATEDRFIIENE